MNQKDKERLRDYINEVSFAILDINLFLDTHPYDEEALKYYRKYRELRREALEEYTRYYGPLLVDQVKGTQEKWKWVEGPWPWEGGC